MNQTLETSASAQTADTVAAEAPSLKVAFFGFVSSTTVACTLMVLLSAI